ncbi:hypothetical protein ANN_17475 [Periplaneta americana]|uniref:Uncharacterized protein n=1 Tax=Periplaneta americana TaxID=6978 RepID=A0ABQ8ST21_PERAM|nr:hypothetical protein ANN_17475 [Periplaneta americana]
MALVDSVALVKKIELDMDSGLGEVGKMLTNIQQELNPSDLVYFKYVLISSDVERSFSMYKSILADNQQSFTFDHLRVSSKEENDAQRL